MKTFLAILFTATSLANLSHATGLFIGADALFGHAAHTAKNPSTNSGPSNNDETKTRQLNYGVNAGLDTVS